jgi:uncharacterized protein (TIGR03437 family)
VSPSGILSTVAGTGLAGFGGDDGPGVQAQLNGPAGLALDRQGNLYIADSANSRVRRLAAGGEVKTVLDPEAGIKPVALAIDRNGRLYAGDGQFLVYQFLPGFAPSVFAGTGPGFAGDGGPASSAQFQAARDLALDGAGDLYVADSLGSVRGLSPLGRVRRIDGRGIIDTVAGDGYLHAIGDGGPATAALLYFPSAVSLDTSGNLYIADTGTQRIRRVDAAGVISTFAGIGLAALGAEQVPATMSALYSPMGVWAEPGGGVLVADTYRHRIRRVDAGGRIASIIGRGTSGAGAENLPWDLAQLNGPRAACTGPGGVIFVVDTLNHRVLRAAPGALVTVAAGNGSPGYAGDGAPARGAQLNTPSACVVDAAGNLLSADTGNGRIRRVDASGEIATVAGGGKAGTGDGGPAVAASLDQPRGLAVDGNGGIFISEEGANRIRYVDSTGVIRTIAGDGGPAGAARFHGPAGLALDGAGDLYVADMGNHRIRRLVPDAAPPAPVTAASLEVLNGASFMAGPVAPGEIVAIKGSGLGPETAADGSPGDSGRLAAALAGVQVFFDSTAAPLFYVQAGQVNAQAPYEIAGRETTHVEVRYNGRIVGAADIAVAAVSPALFQAAANQDGSINSADAPAARGSIVVLFATGEGLTDSPSVTGLAAGAPYAHPRLPVRVAVAGIPAEVLYSGAAPGFVGLMQLNVRVPGGFVAPGAQPVALRVGETAAPELTIWLR